MQKVKTITLDETEMADVQRTAEEQCRLFAHQANQQGAFDEQRWMRSKLLDVGGKIATAKYFNVEIGRAADGKLYGPRLPAGPVLVRTMSKEWGDLILHNSDTDYRIFLLVYGRAPTFQLLGWIRGGDGKNMDYWKDPTGTRPAFFVPQSALRDVDDLKIPVARQK